MIYMDGERIAFASTPLDIEILKDVFEETYPRKVVRNGRCLCIGNNRLAMVFDQYTRGDWAEAIDKELEQYAPVSG